MIRIELSDTAALALMWASIAWAVVRLATLIKKDKT